MKVIIAGSRDFTDYKAVEAEITYLLNQLPKEPHTIISGGARGADQIGIQYARNHNMPCKIYLPDWDKYGRKGPNHAGNVRNGQMRDVADALIALWDFRSSGTRDMIKKMEQSPRVNKRYVKVIDTRTLR
jgi:hypothetical protein